MIVRTLIAASFFLPLPAFAQSARQPGWIVDERTGCRMWDLSPEPGEAVTWSGPCVNRYAEGRGVQRWSTIGRPTDRYSGELRGGKANGRGVYVGADGDRYDGEWKDGRPHGQGTKTTLKGEVYSGLWTNGCFRQGGRTATLGITARECGFK